MPTSSELISRILLNDENLFCAKSLARRHSAPHGVFIDYVVIVTGGIIS